MGILENFQHTLNSLVINTNVKRGIYFIAGIISLNVLIVLLGSLTASYSPFIAVALSWVWFLLPGFVLSFVLVENVAWWERLPISLALSVGATAPITLIAILFRMRLDYFILLHSLTLIFLCIILVIFNSRIPDIKLPTIPSWRSLFLGRTDKIVVVLTAFVVLMAGLLAVLALEWPASGDDIAGLPIFAEVISLNQITGTEPFHGSGVASTPRNELIVWTYLAILANKISGATPIDFFVNSRPFFVVFGFLSLAAFLHQILKDKRKTLFILSLWSVFLLTTTEIDGTGSDFITRIFQDKFVGWFIVIPIVLLFTVWFIQSGDWRKLLGFGIVTFGASMVHPITLTQAMILIAGFGLIELVLKRSKRTFVNLVLIVLVLLACTIIPFIQYLRYSNYFPVELAGLGEAVEFGRLSSAVGRYRLWLLEGNRFILHPAVVLQPFIILAYALMPLAIWRLKKDTLARIISGTLLLLPLLLYVPPLAGIAGRAVTPYLLWRLAWPFPLFAVITIGWAALLLIEVLKERFEKSSIKISMDMMIPIGLLLIFAVIAPQISLGISGYIDRRAEEQLSTCQIASNALEFLNDHSQEKPVNVLSTRLLNFCIPGYAALANVVEFRGFGTVNRLSEDEIEASLQRIEDVNYFEVATNLDLTLIDAMNRQDIDYVLLPKDNLDLDLQLKYQPESFRQVYEDAYHSLYAVSGPLSTSNLLAGNTALNHREFEEAEKIFNQMLVEDPNNVLAILGLGVAEEGLGDISAATDAYRKAVELAPDEPALYAQLANINILKRNFEDAITNYQTALELSPESVTLNRALGRLNILRGEDIEARKNFEKVASLRALNDSAPYYSIMGRLYQSADLLPEALDYFDQAINLDQNSLYYVDKARALTISGELNRAIETYQTAIQVDNWNYLPHLDLGFIYRNNGQLDKAIAEYETACRLKSTNVSGYILLAEAIQEKSGLDAAIARLEELQEINDVLPGPYRGFATLMVANDDYDDALQALDYSAQIQPRSAAIQTAKGYILMANGQMDAAYEAFNQSLFTKPTSISARLGLSLIYTLENRSEKETGQFLQIIRLTPTAAWPHIKLAKAYQRQGNWGEAWEEIRWALELEPDNIDGYLAMGDLEKARSNWESAISNYTQALEIDPENPLAPMALGEIYNNLGDFPEAEKLYLQAISSNPTSIYPQLKLAELYWKQGRFDEATSIEQDAVEMAPDSDLALIKLAEVYRLQGKIDEARALYEQVIQTKPGVVAAYSALAQLAAEEDNDQHVILDLYNKALSANPGSAEAQLAAGRFFMSQGQYDFAQSALQSALTFPDVSPENYLVLSELQRTLGDRSSALETLKTGTNVFPGQAIAYHNLANYYLARGETNNAVQNFDKAIELDPGLIPAYNGISEVQQILGNYLFTERVLQEAIRINPGTPEPYLALARFQESIGSPDLAEENIKKALRMRPTDIEVLQSLSRFYVNQERYDEAMAILEQAMELPGSNFELLMDMGNLHLLLNQSEQAAERYQEARQLNRSDLRPYLALATLHESTENWDQALEILNQALHMQPTYVATNLAMGELLSKMGRFKEAEDFFERARAADLSQINGHLGLANFLSDRGDLQGAIEYLQEAIEISPTTLSPYISLSQLLQLIGDFSPAEAVISQGIENSIDKPNAYLARAAYFDNLGNQDLAKADYVAAWKLVPNSQQVGVQYARFLQNHSDYEAALGVLNQLEERKGENAEIKTGFGNVYFAQAKWEDAILAYTEAINLDASYLYGYLGLAEAYEKLGKTEEAITVYQSAVEHYPQDADALLLLAKAFQSQGLYSDALDSVNQALAVQPYNFPALLKLDQLSRITGEPEVDLIPYANHADEIPSAEEFITLSQLYRLRGEWDTALSWLKRAVALEPLNKNNWIELGDYFRATAQWDQAVETYNQALDVQPNSADIWLALGKVQEELGETEAAIDSYQRVNEIDQGNTAGYTAIAQLLLQNGENDLAIETMNEAISAAPGDFHGYLVLGDIYYALNEFTLAEETYQKGVEVSPGETELFVRLGNLHTDRVLEARDKLQAANSLELLAQSRVETLTEQKANAVNRRQKRVSQLKLKDAVDEYANLHGKLIAAQRQYQLAGAEFDSAKSYYEQALDLSPNFDLALLGLGKLYLALGSETEALEYMQRSLAVNPNSALSLGYLGNTYLELDQPEKAIELFNKLLTLQPNNIFAHLGLSKAYQAMGALDISQAAASVSHSQFNLQYLVDFYRVQEIRDSSGTN